MRSIIKMGFGIPIHLPGKVATWLGTMGTAEDDEDGCTRAGQAKVGSTLVGLKQEQNLPPRASHHALHKGYFRFRS